MVPEKRKCHIDAHEPYAFRVFFLRKVYDTFQDVWNPTLYIRRIFCFVAEYDRLGTTIGFNAKAKNRNV